MRPKYGGTADIIRPYNLVFFYLILGGIMKVYLACSKEDTVSNEYKNLASMVSTKLAELGHTLVSECYDSGMVYKSLMTYKYEDMPILGISSVNEADIIERLDIDNNIVTKNTFERSKVVYNESDLIIILPGGLGTLAELFSFVEETSSTNRKVRIILFNYKNYYSNLLKFLISAHDDNFISGDDIKLISIVNDINVLNEFLERMV
jgi:hypothetical protein